LRYPELRYAGSGLFTFNAFGVLINSAATLQVADLVGLPFFHIEKVVNFVGLLFFHIEKVENFVGLLFFHIEKVENLIGLLFFHIEKVENLVGLPFFRTTWRRRTRHLYKNRRCVTIRKHHPWEFIS
jgi:hypothetical protein